MKRFWSDVAVGEVPGGWAVSLDARPVRTPARASLVVPSATLAEAIADEWRHCGETVDPRAMPLTGLANAAVDRVEPDPSRFAADLGKYAEADLTCYRAEGPASLVARQSAAWDPLLDWARARYDVGFTIVFGIVHAAQPAKTVARLGQALAAQTPFALAGLSPLVTLSGSLVAALAVVEGAVAADQAWDAVSVDERWQLEQWGEDGEARAALEAKARDFTTAARFVALAG